ncbi:hypothetical protein NGA35_09645 [Pseudomonas stutzeri]|nr:hypothetical protein [Stutzerimonas stutzeri]
MRLSGSLAARQRGVVLLVGLVMLLMVTLMAISGFNMVKVNQQVTGNMESRAQALVAANAAIEEAISATLFFRQPGNIFVTSCGAPNTRCYDFNADGTADVTVTVNNPQCVVVTPIMNSTLDITNSNDVGCIIEGSAESLCVDSVWDLEATAVDNVTGARATVRQGVSVRVSLNNIVSACPS